MFETNVFGLANMTKAVLPGMRERGRGHIVNISSMGGLIGFPGIGYYNATKFAVEGLSEALAKETAPLGIKVTIVEPGPFPRIGRAARSRPRKTRSPIMHNPPVRDGPQSGVIAGRQQGDPVRGAEAIIQAVESPEPPLHLLLGRPAYETTTAKFHEFTADIVIGGARSSSTLKMSLQRAFNARTSQPALRA
jgi:NAD(P)-dependent dehydrogenase (short-subunit alcohol dehydrogenase family)